MTFLAALRRMVILLGCCWLWGGCFLDSDTLVDEKKEPHFVAGQGQVNSMDYSGAVESFEKALEVNPHSAAAHFELGLLLEVRKSDFAGAIYHYEHFLKLRPRHEKTEQLSQRIINCKQELARTVSLGPVNQQVQRELERLFAENTRLTKLVESLTSQLTQASQRPAPGEKTNTSAAVSPPAPPQTNRPSPVPAKPAPPPVGGSTTGTGAVSPAPPKSQTHTIKSGDTPAAIARKYGISLNALMSANPGLDPKKLRIGQAINVPVK